MGKRVSNCIMKTLKQNMTMSFNSRRGHAGTKRNARFTGFSVISTL